MGNKKRNGRATSSQMYRVCASLKSGKPSSAFYTYAKEVAMERYLKRSLNTQVKTQPMKWGSLMEVYFFKEELKDKSWSMTHKNTILHEKYGHIWSGTPDLISDSRGICGEIKCFELKNFCLLVMCLEKQDLELFKNDFPQIYWQLVSNCVLSNKKKGEVFAYMPKKEKLRKILIANENEDMVIDYGLLLPDYFFFREENIESFPYLEDDSEINEINRFQFDLPLEDVEFMTKRVLEFEKEVNRILES